MNKGYHVIGVELSEIAVKDFFAENNIDYVIEKQADFTIYSGHKIKIYCGDFFSIDASHFPMVKAVYDRASLVALPNDMRKSYVKKLIEILPLNTEILLSAIEYDQTKADGPPFAVLSNWIKQHYNPIFDIHYSKEREYDAPVRLKKQGVLTVKEVCYIMNKVKHS